MTDKERLEEIKTKYSTLTVSSEKSGTEYTEVDVEDLVFLIQNGFKQAERVQELEEERDEWKYTAQSYYMTNQELREQNKRYREALEEILAESYEEVGLHPDTNMQLETFIAKTARKALERDND